MDANPRIELAIDGMTCAACVRRVERALAAVPGVTSASVNLATRRASVEAPEDARLIAQLIAAVAEAGYHAERGAAPDDDREVRGLRRDLLLALVPSLPLLVIAMAHGAIPGTGGLPGAWVQAGLATVVVFGPGLRFLRLAWTAARHRAADMNTLVSIGILAAWGASAGSLGAAAWTGAHHAELYFEAAAGIICFLLLGRLLEARARRHLGDAVRGLEALRPATARRLIDGREAEVAIADVRPGDVLLVRPGERLSADGTVRAGTSTIDASLITGESMPVEAAPGTAVSAGCLNLTGALELVVERVGDDAAIGRIVRATAAAQGSRAPIARLADRVSAVFVPIVLGIALATFLVWLPFDPRAALVHAVAVLVIACPCALGLATPAAVAVGTGRAAELGVLFADGAALEEAARIDAVLLDKTGTVTSGRPRVVDAVPLPGIARAELLATAAAVERGSAHPLARAIVAAAPEGGRADAVSATAGGGVAGTVDGKTVRLGSAAFLDAGGIDTIPLADEARRQEDAGRTVVLVARGGAPLGVIALADDPAPGAGAAVAALRGLGIRVGLLSGDRPGPVHAVAAALGIADATAEATPERKAEAVRALRAQGRRVAMVGDGINDTPALAGADLGIAIGGGADVATSAARVVLQRDGITALPGALLLARRTLATIRQNLAWAFAYNVLGIPLAAGALVPLTGWSLSPLVASAAMALSSLSVLANSLRLRRVLRR